MRPRPNTLFVRNVDHGVTERELRATLEREIGGVIYVRLIVDREKAGQHKGYGFVSFANRGYCTAALADDGRITLRGKTALIAPTRS